MFQDVLDFIYLTFGTNKSTGFIPLHEPKFIGNEKKYLLDCIDSTYVSSLGKYVDQFEELVANYTGARYAVATVNGTSALHISLLLAGVSAEDEVITQPLTFVATCNAISYCGASPVFIDVDRETLGLSAIALRKFLEENVVLKNNVCVNKLTGKTIKACVPMHTFGHPCKIEDIRSICDEYKIALVEDAAESFGSYYKGKHTGTFGKLGVFSFNGNKIITSGGGGCIITNDASLAKKARHLTTTAKVSHKWNFSHDIIGFNYRMPNINAALLVAQLENIDHFLANKRDLAMTYNNFFSERFTDKNIYFVREPVDCVSNYWLNAMVFRDRKQRDSFLEETNANGIMTRPIWTLMNELDIYKNYQCTDIANSQWLEQRVVNIPSSVRI